MRFELRLFAIASLLIFVIAASCARQSIAEVRRGIMSWERTQAGTQTSPGSASGANDFDFLVGTWDIANRRLKKRHVGSAEWDEFPGRSTMRPVLGGLGNIDEISFRTKGWSGVTLRFFDPKNARWSIYWVNSRDGIMQSPVVGAFRNGSGEFFGDDIDDGKPIRVRFLWRVLDKDTARWEQAFSLDGGRTWETNWVMDLLRVR
jgi:hypothetical protein